MARPSTAHERRQELLPLIARTFAETGYRRATTAELAARCGVPENTLYRLFQDKKQMYLESIEHIYSRTIEIWSELMEKAGPRKSAAEHILDYEAIHYGERGFYRMIFAGLSELDDPDIAAALRNLYLRFHTFIADSITTHRKHAGRRGGQIAELLAWTVIGMGTASGIGRELGLVSQKQQKDLFARVGKSLLDV